MNLELFNAIFNTIGALLLFYIAFQAHANNEAVRTKQFETTNRLDHLLDLTKDIIVDQEKTNGSADSGKTSPKNPSRS